MRPIIFSFCCLLIFLVACNSSEQSLSYTDLLSYGVPIEIQAPDSVEIKSSDIGALRDVILTGPDGYRIQIFASPAYSNKANVIKEYKSEIKNHPQFKEFVREESDGFLYAFQLDSTITNYGFRYITVKGGKEIVIQQGMLGVYTRDVAEQLFNYALQSR